MVLLGQKSKLKGEAKENLDLIENLGLEVLELARIEELNGLGEFDLIIDALFGTGFKGRPKGLAGQLINWINSSQSFVISIDIPSGVDADEGQVEGEAVWADATTACGFLKRGHLLYPGRAYSGELWVADLGLPESPITRDHQNFLTIPEAVANWLPFRRPDGNKGTFGKVLVLAGSQGYTGAAFLTCQAALRAGAGLVRLGMPKSLAPVFEAKLTEAVKVPLPETETQALSDKAYPRISELLSDSQVLIVGPGIGTHPETTYLVERLLKEASLPIVLDADGINNLKGDLELLRGTKASLVITPHPGELARLTGYDIPFINRARIDLAPKLAQSLGCVVMIKGAPTVSASPEGICYINPTGNSGLASGGTGDVLTGMIGGLIAQGLAPFEAAAAAVYLHGLAADLAIKDRTEYCLIASDLFDYLPRAIQSLYEEEA
jgi:NAD(P)H-hydrate epimerase